MAIRLDLTKAKPQKVDPGTYEATFVAYEEREGKNAPYYRCEFLLDVDGEERRMYSNLSTSEKAAWKIAEFAEACGSEIDWDDEEALSEWEFDIEEFIESRLLVTVDVDPNDEQERTQINNFSPIPKRKVARKK